MLARSVFCKSRQEKRLRAGKKASITNRNNIFLLFLSQALRLFGWNQLLSRSSRQSRGSDRPRDNNFRSKRAETFITSYARLQKLIKTIYFETRKPLEEPRRLRHYHWSLFGNSSGVISRRRGVVFLLKVRLVPLAYFFTRILNLIPSLLSLTACLYIH
jgi:hypothetical protein